MIGILEHAEEIALLAQPRLEQLVRGEAGALDAVVAQLEVDLGAELQLEVPVQLPEIAHDEADNLAVVPGLDEALPLVPGDPCVRPLQEAVTDSFSQSRHALLEFQAIFKGWYLFSSPLTL